MSKYRRVIVCNENKGEDFIVFLNEDSSQYDRLRNLIETLEQEQENSNLCGWTFWNSEETFSGAEAKIVQRGLNHLAGTDVTIVDNIPLTPMGDITSEWIDNVMDYICGYTLKLKE